MPAVTDGRSTAYDSKPALAGYDGDLYYTGMFLKGMLWRGAIIAVHTDSLGAAATARLLAPPPP
jgi:hypothetical protein